MTMDIDALIARAKAHIEKPESQSKSVLAGDDLIEVEFTKLEPLVWVGIKAVHPPRPGVVLDGNLGYNADEAPRSYPAGSIKVEGAAVTQDQWEALFPTFAAPSIRDVATLAWGLNDFTPSTRATELLAGKASAGGSKKKSSSPAN